MQNLVKYLKEKLTDAHRIAVLAIGSEFRGDDAAGLFVADELTRLLKKPHKNIKVFVGATAPENLTGDIKRYKPSHILLIDSVDFNEKAGSIVVLNPADIGDGVSFSTHKMPAKVLMRYFKESMDCETILIGIQPKSIDFGKDMSKTVISAAKEVAKAVRASFK